MTLSHAVGSELDRDELVADLICGDTVWAEITDETGRLEIEIHGHPGGRSWCFPLDEMMAVLPGRPGTARRAPPGGALIAAHEGPGRAHGSGGIASPAPSR